MKAVYLELRAIAQARLAGEHATRTINPTELVSEAWIRLQGDHTFQNRAHFFGAAGEAMRRVLVDQARARLTAKRGEGQQPITLDGTEAPPTRDPLDVLALEEGLRRLERGEPEKARLVELCFFAGLTQAEAAEVLGISVATAERWWAYARAFLFAELGGGDAPPRP